MCVERQREREMEGGWDAIRGLDEEENWAERNRVLSKKDHLELMESAKVWIRKGGGVEWDWQGFVQDLLVGVVMS